MLKRHIKDCFKINGKKRIIISKKDEYVQFINYKIEIMTPFIIYEDFKSIKESFKINGK